MRAAGAKGVAGGAGRVLRCAGFVAAVSLLPIDAEATEPCQTIADAIASQAEWEVHDIVDIADPFDSVRGIDEIRAQLQSVDPALLDAMTPAIEAKPGAVGWWLTQADIDGDGSPEWWLRSNQGTAYCETNWFFRSTAPYEFVGQIGGLEGDCGVHARPIAIAGEPYILQTDYGAELEYPQYDLLQWRQPDAFAAVCRVRPVVADEFQTETDCAGSVQSICDAIAGFAAPLIRTDDTALAGAVVDDATILSTLSFRQHSDTLVQYADIDNDGNDEIFASESLRSSPLFRFDYFGFSILQSGKGELQPIDPNEAYAGLKEVINPYDYNPDNPGYYGTYLRALFPVRVADRVYLVERSRADRDDPGDFVLRILIVENGRAGTIGRVYATPVMRGEIEMAP